MSTISAPAAAGNELLTMAEVAEILRLGRSATYRLLKSGEIRAFWAGGRVRVPAIAVQRYLEGHPYEPVAAR